MISKRPHCADYVGSLVGTVCLRVNILSMLLGRCGYHPATHGRAHDFAIVWDAGGNERPTGPTKNIHCFLPGSFCPKANTARHMQPPYIHNDYVTIATRMWKDHAALRMPQRSYAAELGL